MSFASYHRLDLSSQACREQFARQAEGQDATVRRLLASKSGDAFDAKKNDVLLQIFYFAV
jgi:hypothetical protein